MVTCCWCRLGKSLSSRVLICPTSPLQAEFSKVGGKCLNSTCAVFRLGLVPPWEPALDLSWSDLLSPVVAKSSFLEKNTRSGQVCEGTLLISSQRSSDLWYPCIYQSLVAFLPLMCYCIFWTHVSFWHTQYPVAMSLTLYAVLKSNS